jgi:hypothetical protein
LSAPTIPASSTQAVQTTGGGTTPFTMAWYNFFAGLLSFVTTGPLGPVPLVGVTDGSNAAAGNVGEYISNIVPFGSGHTMSNGVAAQLATITLSAGDWDVDGVAYFGFPATITTTFYVGFISTSNSGAFPGTSAPSDGGFDYCQQVPGSGATGITSTEPYTINGLHTRVNSATSVTLYLMGDINFSGSGTVTGYGALRARRMR